MGRDGFPFRKLWHNDFALDHAVQRMTPDEKRRFLWACLMIAPDAEVPGAGTEEEWRDWLDYAVEEWPERRGNFLRAMKVQENGSWFQERVFREHEERVRSRAQRVSAGQSRQQRSLSGRSAVASERSAPAIRVQSTEREESTPLPAGAGVGNGTSHVRKPRRERPDEPPGFVRFYEVLYPKRVSRDDAALAWGRKIRWPEDEALVEANTPLWVKRWAAEDRDLKTIPYPATYLNAGTWREPPPEE